MKNKNLTVVGLGIKFFSHITKEVEAYIRGSDKVLYLVNEPLMKEWIRKINPNSESLDEIYHKYDLRDKRYKEITKYILKDLLKNVNLCVVLYGHPCVYADPALNAVIKARKKGFNAQIIPSISAEDCLFADLLIDPGTIGCQSFEATDLLLYERVIEPRSHLVLWQVDVTGIINNISSTSNNKNLMILSTYLNKFYPDNHPAILYEAAQYPTFKPLITKITLKELSNASITSISTLYIPPIKQTPFLKKVAKQLNIKV